MSPTHQDLSNDTTFSQIKSRVPVPLNEDTNLGFWPPLFVFPVGIPQPTVLVDHVALRIEDAEESLQEIDLGPVPVGNRCQRHEFDAQLGGKAPLVKGGPHEDQVVQEALADGLQGNSCDDRLGWLVGDEDEVERGALAVPQQR